MTGLAVVAGAVGIASFGIQVCQGLLSYYEDVKDYKVDISSTYDTITDLAKTLSLLKGSLEREGLSEERSERVKTCLQSCEDGLTKLSQKLQELRRYDTTKGIRQKVLSIVQRMHYPFRAETLAKLRENVEGIQGRLGLALQVLQLDASATIETSAAQISVQQQSLLAAQDAERFRKVVDWLSPPNPWTNHTSARERHQAQTGEWLLECDQYQRWKADAIRHVWVCGKAGCGKTVLCSTAVEDIQLHCETQANTGFAIFYFSFSDDRKQTYENLLRSLVGQLGWKEPGRSMLCQVYDKTNQKVPGVDELEKILRSSIDAFKSAFLMMDALDESPEDCDIRQTVLGEMDKLTQSAPNLKIFATSREIRDIREVMKKLKADQVLITARATDTDIQRFVSSQISDDPRLQRLKPESKAAIKKTISQKADGMFRWAYCQLQELKKLPSTKPKYIIETLRTLPMTLDETYARILTGIAPMFHSEACTLLRWLAYARSPPSLAELAEAAIIDPFVENSIDSDNRGDFEDTMNILSGLVTIVGSSNDIEVNDDTASDVVDVKDDGTHNYQPLKPDTRVQLAHFSVKEFLESGRMPEKEAMVFHLEPALGHHFLTQSCLKYILYYSSSNKTSSKWDLETFPLLQYAAMSWYYHSALQQCGEASLEALFLSSQKVLRDWLHVHQPDQGWWTTFFTNLESIGSSLYYASLCGLRCVVALLIEQGEPVNVQGGYYGNALQAAVYKGYIEIVKLLLNKGADINAQGGC
ncbi:hypothetical protein EV356DRAFT_257150 [Viridothelium virens]|uniref:Nephrocystin 3-like N-terminal domain-containing protein n=1 Tax=Viridothelium virens TaxID=1048519 RepID=A0A6A6H3M6_VIRVR|nr:hypothetical protein EV356DRAFT_257150 [Viridothelium virens]